MRKQLMAGHATTAYTTYELRAERPMMVKPVILREFHDRDGIRMYKTIDGKFYIADTYDNVFISKARGKVLARPKKENPDGRRDWML